MTHKTNILIGIGEFIKTIRSVEFICLELIFLRNFQVNNWSLYIPKDNDGFQGVKNINTTNIFTQPNLSSRS